MRLSLAALIALLATRVTGTPTVDQNKDADAIMGQIQSEAMEALVKAEKSSPRRQASECSVGKAHIRRALREECGYKGYQPYWNWFKDTEDLSKSPVFDGSPTSLGGDGDYFPHNGSMGGGNTIYFPSGKGGGYNR
ncbi:uncharacterized protein PG986_002757 [Apiospora aurea]|uniref:Tyrosinase copper-binding domain-containing protein n=1 Tax=Apiospora aurea TaxID=335848 RepID=A0ABR1QQL0_9PEZI